MVSYSKAISADVSRLATPFRTPQIALRLTWAALVLSGCSTLTPRPLDTSAADPKTHARPAGYRSAIGGFVSRRPVDPDDWKTTNERVAPPPKAAE